MSTYAKLVLHYNAEISSIIYVSLTPRLPAHSKVARRERLKERDKKISLKQWIIQPKDSS
jgi:hypothetical protein